MEDLKIIDSIKLIPAKRFRNDFALNKRKKINNITNNLENYKKILKASKLLSDELGLDNSLEIANFYTFLLWNGYFSKDKTMCHQSAGRLVIPGMYSQDIMNGIGTCLNFSDMLTDFLNEFDFSSATLISAAGDSKKTNYKPDIKLKINKICDSELKKPSLSLKLCKKIVGTHAVNLIKENDYIYIYDPTNINVYRLVNKSYAKLINGEGELLINPYISYGYNISDKSINTLKYLYNTKNFISSYDDEKFKEIWIKCLELIKNNINLLDNFYDEIFADIIKIYNTNQRYYLTINEIIKTK